MRKVGDDSDDEVEADETHCDVTMQPRDTNYCTKPCSGGCVVEEWSEWNKCNHVSKKKSVRA